MRLGTNKSALRTAVWSRELPAFLATPDQYLATVRTEEFCRFGLRRDYPVA